MRRHLPIYLCEFAGTAILLFVGVSAVAFMWAPGSPLPVIANPLLRRLVTGVLFASGATAVVYSPLGQRSGAHINPAVTLAFWRMGKMPLHDAVGYVVAQILGATAGTFLAGLAFHDVVAGVQYAVTLPGAGYTLWWALAGETLITFLLVLTIFYCVNHPWIASRTGLVAGALVALIVMIESPVSGASLNPARSLAPALLVSEYAGLWIYFTGPALGALLAVAVYRAQWQRAPACAKLFHTAKYPCHFHCGHRDTETVASALAR